MNIAGAYLTKNGYTQEEVNAISMSRHWKTIVDASKYEATQKKKTAVKKRLLKTPKAKAPTANSKSKLAPHEIMYGADT